MGNLQEEITLNDNGTADWQMSRVGRDGVLYSGQFRFKTGMDPLAIIAADRDYRQLLGANPAFAADHVSNMAFALAQLRQRVMTSPPFWVDGSPEFGGGRTHYEIIQAVFDAALAAQEKHEEQLRARAAATAEKIRAQLEAYSKDKREREREEGKETGLDAAGKG